MIPLLDSNRLIAITAGDGPGRSWQPGSIPLLILTITLHSHAHLQRVSNPSFLNLPSSAAALAPVPSGLLTMSLESDIEETSQQSENHGFTVCKNSVKNQAY